MTSARTQAPVSISVPSDARAAARRWRHPFDTAAGTIALGVVLTVILFVALQLLGG